MTRFFSPKNLKRKSGDIAAGFRHVLQIYPTPFTHESRMLREINALLESGVVKRVTVCAMSCVGLPECETIRQGFNVWRVGLWSANLPDNAIAKTVRFVEWSVRILLRYLSKDIDAIQCHSLSTLPIGIVFRLIRRQTRFIYDAHECETETSTATPMRRMIGRVIERLAFCYIDVSFVVSQSILEWYANAYNPRRICLLRNIPDFSQERRKNIERDVNLLRLKTGISQDKIVCLYQGAIGRGRGIEMMLEAFSSSPESIQVVFMGYGELVCRIKEYACKYGNVHYLPAVEPEDLYDYTRGADIGLCLLENTCLNHYFCLPNKLFEYVQCGVPVLASNFPEIARVISETAAGWVIHPDSGSMLKFFSTLTVEVVAQKKEKAKLARGKYNWDEEKTVLLDEYRALIR